MPSAFPLCLLAATLLAACTTTAPTPSASTAAPAFDLSRLRLIDLSHPFNAKTIYWPNSPTSFALSSQANGKTPGGWYYRANSFASPEHGGTHLDAPSHFAEQGYASDQIPLTQLVAPAVVIDISAMAAKNADYLLTRDDVLAFEKTHGVIPAGSMVLLRTGWSSKWPDKKAYLGDDTPGRTDHLHFPSFSPEAAALLVDERKVAVLGADVASIDYGQSPDFQVHRLAMAKNVAVLENLTNLDSLPATGAFVVALPMKIEGGSGGPLRAMALVPREAR